MPISRDIQAKDDLGYRWTYYWRYADQYSRFDFIFVNKALVPEVQLEKCYIGAGAEWFDASDHRPVVGHHRPERPLSCRI